MGALDIDKGQVLSLIHIFGCSNANVKENWLSYICGLRKCPHYWLDQNRFTPVDGNRW